MVELFYIIGWIGIVSRVKEVGEKVNLVRGEVVFFLKYFFYLGCF